MKEKIKKTMELIIKEELSKNASLNSATYKDQRVLINSLFCKEGYAYSKGTILLRLAVIDSLYSTNAGYSYFSFDEMAEKIFSIGNGNEEASLNYFYEIAKGEKDTDGLFCEEYGIRKNLAKGSQQMSLMTKYAYYALLQDKKNYTLGFPIYDRLAKEAYPIVCKMLNEKEIHKFSPIETPTIEDYVECLNQIRSKLFDNEKLFLDHQQFDILDAYLWRMGKFEEGNFSLLLNKDEYWDFIKEIGLNITDEETPEKYNERIAKHYIAQKETGALTEKQYVPLQINAKERNLKNGNTKLTFSFDFNKSVALELERAISIHFSNTYITELYTHWRDEYHKTKTIGNE